MKRFSDIEEFEALMRELLEGFKKECPSLWKHPHYIAEFLARRIRESYDVEKRDYKEPYLLIAEGVRLPCCRGCGNEFGSCGTPCWNCEKKAEFEKEWTWYLWLPNQFGVWKRKEKKT